MNSFHFRGNNRPIILPKSASTLAGYKLARCERLGAVGQLVRKISPHLALNVNALNDALSHACALLKQAETRVSALADTQLRVFTRSKINRPENHFRKGI